MNLPLIHHPRTVGLTVSAILLLAASMASAQTKPLDATDTWSHGTTLEIFGGVATASPNTTGTFGGAAGWELNHLAEIEGIAAWLSERSGAQAFAADLKLLVNLRRPALLVPYVGGGAGMYVGSFDTRRTTMPSFYQRRNAELSAASRESFTDPTVVIAGGANVYVARHFSIRPELAARFVTKDSHTYRVTTVTFALAYHVEEHAVGK